MPLFVPSVVRVEIPALEKFSSSLDRFTALGEKALAYQKEQDALDTSNQEAQKAIDEASSSLEQSTTDLQSVLTKEKT